MNKNHLINLRYFSIKDIISEMIWIYSTLKWCDCQKKIKNTYRKQTYMNK